MKQEISRPQGETHPQPTTPDRHFSVQLSATRRGARLARLLATEQLRSWGLPLDSAAHVIAELAANAALHGRVPGRDFRLTLTATARTLRIEVTDARGDRLPQTDGQSAGSERRESGRGLLLVDALADRWGTVSGPKPCKTVWAEHDLTTGPDPEGPVCERKNAMPALSLFKAHGSRNDIFVIDGAPDDHFATADEITRAVSLLCDRRRGLGGDGAYFVADGGDGTARAWFFNPDGSEALLCGNGMRCAGRVLLDRHQADSVLVHTGPYSFTVRDRGRTPHGVRQVSVELPPVDFAPARPVVADAGPGGTYVDRLLPAFHASRRVTAVAVPNSHLVTVIDAYDEAELVETGRRVAAAPAHFPIGANLSFVLPLADDEVFVHTYERGAGLTPSCGSGVAASRAVLSRLGLVEPERPVVVRNPGGVARSLLQPTGDGGWQPVLEGNATVVYRTELDPAALLGGGPVEFSGETHMAEIDAFGELNGENLKALREAGISMTAL